MVLRKANSLKMYGERYSWFVGTKSSNASFDASCCTDMKVILVHPKDPSGSQLRIMKGLGLTEEPLLESAFYADLAVKSLAAVGQMKKGKCCNCEKILFSKGNFKMVPGQR